VGQDRHVGVFLVGAGLADVFEAGVGQHGEDGLDLSTRVSVLPLSTISTHGSMAWRRALRCAWAGTSA
jgi:hypothetical protein